MLFQFFGQVRNPLNVLNPQGYGDVNTEGAGIIAFASNIIKLITIVAGIWAMFNFLFAGFTYITSQGDPKGLEAARQKIFFSIIGLFIMVGTLSMTAVLSKILFGEWFTILRPMIYGPGIS